MPANENRLELLLLGRPLIRIGDQELVEAPPLEKPGAALLPGRHRPTRLTRGAGHAALGRNARRNCPHQPAPGVEPAAQSDRRLSHRWTVTPWPSLSGRRRGSTPGSLPKLSLGAQGRPPTRCAWPPIWYRGAFLDDFWVPDAPGFETWVITEREWFHQLMLAGLQQLVTSDRAAGRDHDAINVARRMLQVAPWHEEAHQELMELLARTGQRSAALAQYELCRRLLDEELGVPPSTKTDALRAQIAAGALEAQ